MTVKTNSTGARDELEAKILLAALKHSFELGDSSGTELVYRELGVLLKSRQALAARIAPQHTAGQSHMQDTAYPNKNGEQPGAPIAAEPQTSAMADEPPLSQVLEQPMVEAPVEEQPVAVVE